MKKLLAFFVALISLSFNAVFAYDYTIDSYNVKMVVNKDKTMDITETIGANFLILKHGIYRDIPTFGVLTRADDTKTNYRAKISDVEVNNNPYTLEKIGNNLRIKIGDPNQTLKGKKQYVIKYKYFMGNDPLESIDEFYFNIVGAGWDVPINNITFSIQMPSPFDSSKIVFSTDTKGAEKPQNAIYRVKGNLIHGYFKGVISPKSHLAIRLELPDKYFTPKPYEFSFYDLNMFLFALPLIFLLVSFMMWYAYGRDGKMYEVLDFTPPDGINPVEAAYIYSQSVSAKDVSSLLIYLASKGYIAIEDIGGDGLFSKTDCKITQLKPYDGYNVSENIFINAFFADSAEIYLSDLNDNYKIQQMTKSIIKKTPKYIYAFEKDSLIKQKLVAAFMVISFLAINCAVCYEAGILSFGFVSTFYLSSLYYVFIKPIADYICTGIFKKGFIAFGCIAFFICAYLMLSMPLESRSEFIPYYVAGILCILAMQFLYFYMPKWTRVGKNIYQRVLGFKKYLEKAEADRLKKLVEKDPQYFYNILPYAYVFGISDKWIKKFENITCEPPRYYRGNYAGMHTFRRIDSIMAEAATSCAPPSGGTGGGFGGGGGGGGSW